jgi:hypothetical protein
VLQYKITIPDKSIDEEEYMRFRIYREKMAGGNFREGSMEVAFELWIEQMILSKSNGGSHRYQGKQYRNDKKQRFEC